MIPGQVHEVFNEACFLRQLGTLPFMWLALQ